MYINKIQPELKQIKVAIPLTKGTNKTRIKQRSIVNEYGIPVATRKNPFTQSCYVEWQIGYDVGIKDENKVLNTTLKNKTFIGANGKTKFLYELSEYLSYFYNWGVISKKSLLVIKNFLETIEPDEYLDKNPELLIKRSNLIDKKINNIDYWYAKVEYPILIHKFDKYEIITEIIIKEKQYAVGTQPMLYFCFPITELEHSENILGRPAKQNEIATGSSSANSLLVKMSSWKLALE